MAEPAPLLCDLTQSWSQVGGGVGTYLRAKRRHILGHSAARHLLILPGARDATLVEAGGRAITRLIASPKVPGSPNYRLMLRNRAVSAALDEYRPALIECQDSYNLPWAAIGHRRAHPDVALVAAYCTDFPTVYVERPWSPLVGASLASGMRRLADRYCALLYRQFDVLFAMSEHGGANRLRGLGLDPAVVPLGVELDDFSPARRDPALRASLGLADDDKLLIYAGRLDREKQPAVVVEAFRRLALRGGARLVLLGDGPLRAGFAALGDPAIVTPGYVSDRADLARWLASADLYVSAMADETFGISVIEAQASGLPVVGVAAGAMVDRVPPALGRLGPVGDAAAMADNIAAMLRLDLGEIGRQARGHALGFRWSATMEALFNHVYPAAFAAAARRAGAAQCERGSTAAVRP